MAGTAKVVIYGSEFCGYCTAARMLLKKKGVDYDDILITSDADARNRMIERTGRTSVPQIFINDVPIGGFDELYALDTGGELDALLAASNDND